MMVINDERGSILLGTLICILVLAPTEMAAGQQVVEVLSQHEKISLFASTIKDAGVDAELNSQGPYTIFAPSNNALQSIKDKLERSNSSTLKNFVMNHVLTGMATKRQIMAMSKAPTLGGLVLEMTVDQNNDILINNVAVEEYNIRAKNGVIHVIGGTLE